MRRVMVNATASEIESARQGPVRWDVAVHGALLTTRFASIGFVALPRRSRLDTRRLRAALRSPGPAEQSMAPGGVATHDPLASRPSAQVQGVKARLEMAARRSLETDIVIVPKGVDAVFSHLRGVRTLPRRVPLVRSTNGVIPEAWTWPPGDVRTAVRDQMCALERGLCRHAERVVCWTSYGADNLAQAGVDSRRIVVVPPLLDLAAPVPPALAPTELVRAVFVGEDAALKGLPEVLAAVAVVPAVELHVVGPRPLNDPPPRTHWRGPLPPAAVSGLVAGCDLLVVPARCESFGVTHLEAMRHGVAVIGSSIGTTSEIVGDAGVLVRPGAIDELVDALASLAADAPKRGELARKGRRRYEECYAPAVVAPQLERALTA